MTNIEINFITTVTQLMRLTREGSISWSETTLSSATNAIASSQGGGRVYYQARYRGLLFSIEGDNGIPYYQLRNAHSLQLFIFDPEDNSTVASPRMKPVADLVAVIQRIPGSQKLDEINKRLAEF